MSTTSPANTGTEPLHEPRPAPDSDVVAALERHRHELTGYCYRMLASWSEADDAVQETFLRAWRAANRFEGRSSVRTWLYRIAHHVCVDMHRSPQRRARPLDLAPATPQPGATPGEPGGPWVEPIPDDRVVGPDADPASAAATRESIRLAFVAALQHLPPKQRSVLVLCEVLQWSAAETAELLGTSVASVTSALQRGRATLAARRAEPLSPVTDPDHAALIARYVDAFERYDIAALVALLRDDAVLTMPPYPLWLQGRDHLGGWFAEQGIGCRGARLVPIAVSGTYGFGNYRVAGPGRWEPFGIQVIEVAGGAIVGHHNFLEPGWFTRFGLPPFLTADDSGAPAGR